MLALLKFTHNKFIARFNNIERNQNFRIARIFFGHKTVIK